MFACFGQNGVARKGFTKAMLASKGHLDGYRSIGTDAAMLQAKTVFGAAQANFFAHHLDRVKIPATDAQGLSRTMRLVYYQDSVGGIMLQLAPVREILELGNSLPLSIDAAKPLVCSQFSAQMSEPMTSLKFAFDIEKTHIQFETRPSYVFLAALVSAAGTPNLLSLAATEEKLGGTQVFDKPTDIQRLIVREGLAINSAIALHKLAVDLTRLDLSISRIKRTQGRTETHFLLIEKEFALEPAAFHQKENLIVFSRTPLFIVNKDATDEWISLLDKEQASFDRLRQFVLTFRLINSINLGYINLTESGFTDNDFDGLLKICKPYFDKERVDYADEEAVLDMLKNRAEKRG